MAARAASGEIVAPPPNPFPSAPRPRYSGQVGTREDEPSAGELGMSPSRVASILDAVAHPIFVKDRSFRFVLLNQAFIDLVGYPREELLGKTDYDFFREAEARFFREKDLELLRTSSTVRIEEEPITDAAGRVHILATTKVPLRDSDGDVTHIVGIIHDITKLKEAEDRLRVANEELESRVRERTAALLHAQHRLIRQERLAVLGQLIGGLAHQIRNPLGAITNATFVLRRLLKDSSEPDVRRSLDILLEEAQQANRIVTDLVEYARVRPPTPERVSLESLVREVLKRSPPPDEVEVEVLLDTLPPVSVDPGQLADALTNLLQNAYEAVPRPGGRILCKGSVDGSALVVAVEDSGTGVPDHAVARLFEPLVTTKANGLGLGLATARTLVENQSGSLTYRRSTLGGACFEVRLPTE